MSNESGYLVLADLRNGLSLFRYWLYLAFIKLQLEHKKTSLSLLWEVVTVFFVAGVLSIVWSKILDIDNVLDYFAYVLIGFTLWNQLFAKLVNRGVSSISKKSNILTVMVKPISILPFEEIAYSYLKLFIVLPFVLVISFSVYGFSAQLLLVFIFGLCLVLLTALSLCFTLGVLAFFIRDILQIVTALMRLGFLITPIIWRPERLGEYAYLVWFNPFYSYLDICRSSLMGKMPDGNSIIIASILTVILSGFAYCVLSIYGNQIRKGVFLN